MIPLLLAVALSFLPTQPDTTIGPAGDFQYPEGGPYCVVRIIPVDSITVTVPVWWVKDIMRRIEFLERRTFPYPGYQGELYIIPS